MEMDRTTVNFSSRKYPKLLWVSALLKLFFWGGGCPPASIVIDGPVASFLPCLIKLSTPFSHLD